jgi:hypothetical protein
MIHRPWSAALPIWMALVGLFWLPGVQAQQTPPNNCAEIGLQTILISGQSQVQIGQPTAGTGFVCYDPQNHCYLAVGEAPLFGIVPFTAQSGAAGLTIQSQPQCGQTSQSFGQGKDFQAVLSGQNGCFNRLAFQTGPFTGGQLVDDPAGPAVSIDEPPVLVDLDLLISGNSLHIPFSHNQSNGAVLIPLIGGRAISVQNQQTRQMIGTITGSCGARLSTPGAPPTPLSTLPVPSASRWSLVGLSIGLLFMAVWLTRRRVAA